MVDLLFIGIRLSIRFADAFRDDALVALRVARILAVVALHAGRILEEFATQRAAHDVVKLMLDEFVSVHLMDLFLALTDGALPTESQINRPSAFVLLDEVQGKVNRARRLERKPSIDWLVGDLGGSLRPKLLTRP